MEDLIPEQLLLQLRELDEHPRIEAKRGSAIGASVMQTICAFANELGLGGGYLLLGIAEPDECHKTFHVVGVDDSDKLLGELQNNCREQFEQSIAIKAMPVILEGKRVVVIFVPELEPVSKPCVFKGRFDSKNKRKTGVWRRGLNGDYECSQQELEPLLLAKQGMSFEQVIPADAEWDDLDPQAIALYRQLRQKVRPHAEELHASDQEMLRALNLVKRQNGIYIPNIAGLLLLGKSLALRRLLPAMRVDYVRIQGTQWVENPDQRFTTTLDIREPLLRLIPKLEAHILDDMPRHFRLLEGESQRSDQPLLPQKVVREAIINAVMHRDYQVNQPTLVVRYSNRLEIRNAGYSLKPEITLGEMGSKLRNPILAAVLYDLDFAETKGSGIRTMRRLLEQAGLSVPVFNSNTIHNYFSAIYLLHQLLGEEQLEWLQQFKVLALSANEAKALILAKETGAVDNAGLRAVTGLDTLSASQVLCKLNHQRQLLTQGGAGPSTYYELCAGTALSLLAVNTSDLDANTSDLDANTSDLDANTSDLDANTSDLDANTSDLYSSIHKLEALPDALKEAIQKLTRKSRKDKLHPVLLWLCAIRAYKAEQLAKLLSRQIASLKSQHLNYLRETLGFLQYTYPEVMNHPEQAYTTTEAGKIWLKEQGIEV